MDLNPDEIAARPLSPETVCAHWAEQPSRFEGAVVPPLFQNSLFTFPTCEAWEGDPDGGGRTWFYTRVSNPTTAIVEAKIAALEKAESARCFSSGMGAISAAIMSCVSAGGHVVVPETCYGPTRQFLSDYLPAFGVETTFVDGRRPESIASAMRPNTSLVYLESPSSVQFYQQDLAAAAEIARKAGARTVCDNSWASPYFQNPIELGVDVVLHSATKYLGGHSDIVAGVVAGSREYISRLVDREGCLLGAVLDPFASWLLLRGLRTLPIRMERHMETACSLSERMAGHREIERVIYPGHASYEQSELSAKQLRGFSGLMTVVLRQSSRARTYAFVNRLKLFGIGCSWGGFESLAIPVSVTGSDGAPCMGVRMHLGLEGVEDLWADISEALEASAE